MFNLQYFKEKIIKVVPKATTLQPRNVIEKAGKKLIMDQLVEVSRARILRSKTAGMVNYHIVIRLYRCSTR